MDRLGKTQGNDGNDGNDGMIEAERVFPLVFIGATDAESKCNIESIGNWEGADTVSATESVSKGIGAIVSATDTVSALQSTDRSR